MNRTKTKMAKASTPSKYIPKGDKAVKIAALMGSERPRIHSSRNISVLKFTMAMTSKNSLVWSGHLIAIFPKIAVACGRQHSAFPKHPAANLLRVGIGCSLPPQSSGRR
jgi:hypothetical protein